MSLFHVIEEVHAPTFPHFIPQLIAVAHWNMADEDMDRDFQVQLVVFEGQEGAKTYNQNFTATRRRQRTILGFAGFKIGAPGRHKIDLRINNIHKASHAIIAQVMEPPPIPVIQPD